MSGGIAEWYKGRKVFVTGGTGFMGKVLLEKLLRCCPEIDTIYTLSRPKKGLSPAARIADFSKLAVFERLIKEQPGALKKITIVEGDMTKDDLGLSQEDRETLANNVTVVFHLGATVRLEAGIKVAVNHNTAGSLRVLELAKSMKHLESYVHVSTAFSHCDIDVLEEKVYPSPIDPREIIRALEWMNDEQAKSIAPKLIGPHPNSYTYSKRLAEGLVEEFSDSLPVTIVRPSIVIPALFEPIPGWVDSLNGPVGMLTGAGKGLVRSMIGNPDNNVEAVPVDIATNAFIAAAWRRTTVKIERGVVPVYNVSASDCVRVSWGEMVRKGKKILQKYPFDAGLWYPNGEMHTNPYKHALIVLFCQTLPAYLVDLILPLVGHKKFLVGVQSRIKTGMSLMEYFTTKDWKFKIDQTLGLTDKMNEDDRKTFYLGNITMDVEKYLTNSLLGSRVYLLKEPLSSLPRARRQMKMLYVLDITVKTLLVALLFWITTGFVTSLSFRS